MNLQLFDNPEFGKVRVIIIDGELWFVANDVASALGFGNPRQALKSHVDDEDKGVHDMDTPGGYQSVTVINESGLYSLILRSNLDSAKRFKHWITSEVIPSIRKTGLYVNPNAPIDPEFLRRIADEIESHRRKIAVLKTQVAELQPKAAYYDLILQCPDLVSTSQIAKDYGMSAKAFNTLLHRLGVQFNQGGVWLLYQKFARLGWTSTKTHVFTDKYGHERCRVHTYRTQRGRLGLYELLKRNGYLPTIEQAA